MYARINILIQLLSAACILAGLFLPFLGLWYRPVFELHLLAMTGFFVGMCAGKGAAILRDNRRNY